MIPPKRKTIIFPNRRAAPRSLRVLEVRRSFCRSLGHEETRREREFREVLCMELVEISFAEIQEFWGKPIENYVLRYGSQSQTVKIIGLLGNILIGKPWVFTMKIMGVCGEHFPTMWGPRSIAKLVYNSSNYGLWYANNYS